MMSPAKRPCIPLLVLLGALFFVCASHAHKAIDEKGLNFRRHYNKNLKGLVDDFPIAPSTDQVEKRAASKCWPGFSPEKNDKMSTCCWYGAQTCCKSSVAGHILPVVAQQLELVYKNGTRDKCYIAVADLLCLWCSPETATFTEARLSLPGDRYISVSICMSVCQKLWDSCHDQQATFGINPPALTPRQLCSALLIEEEDSDGPEGGVNVIIAPESSSQCYGGASLSVVENSNCLPHVTKSASPSGPSGGAIAAMVLVPFLVIISTVVAVVVYFRVRKRRESLVYLGAGGGGGGGNDFSLPADAFGEEGGFLDEEGDISEGSGSGGLLGGEEDSIQ